MFHGPALQVLYRLAHGPDGASGELAADHPGLPGGLLQFGLLDGIWSMVRRTRLPLWVPDLPGTEVFYPLEAERMEFFAEAPRSGRVRAELRLAKNDPVRRLIHFRVELSQGDTLWARLAMAVVRVPLGPFGRVDPRVVPAYLRDRVYHPDLLLSSEEGGQTRLALTTVRALDFLPGTLAALYGGPEEVRGLTAAIAVKEHFARQREIHPGLVEYDPETGEVRSAGDGAFRGHVRVHWEGPEVFVRAE
jgi:hypothetical protein